MRRRAFIRLLGGAVLLPLGARAQQPGAMPRIAVMMGSAESDPESPPRAMAFERGLAEAGWLPGRNVHIVYRWAASEPARMEALAKELVELRPDVILASSTPVVASLVRETRSIPIVFVVVSDPVGSGFVASLPRPGGNITGFINIESSLGGKWIELLKQMAPRITRVAAMFNPETAPQAGYYVGPFEAAAPSLAGRWVFNNGELTLRHDPIQDNKPVTVTGQWKDDDKTGTIRLNGVPMAGVQ